MSDEMMGAGAGAHPDLDRLADLDGDVDGSGDVRAHVETCPQCRAALEALRAARSEVADLPEATMPPEVAARIDAALETERGSGGTPADTVVPISDARTTSRRRGGLIAGSVAASVIAALVVALVLNATGHNNKTTKPTAASAASLGAPALSVVRSTGANYTSQTLDSLVATLLRTPPVLTADAQAGTAAGGTSSTTGTTGSGANTNSQPGGQAATAPHATKQEASGGLAALPPQLGTLQTNPTAMSQCINSLLGAPPFVAPEAVDLARYNGKPEAIFVFPKTNDPAHVRVFVVPPGGCATGLFDFYKNSVAR